MTYRLSRKAEEDIVGIFRQGVELFGTAQAERYHLDLQRTFELIAAHPLMARERTEISPPVRIHPHGAHIIVYLAEGSGDVLIVRVRHGHEDWEND
jgi:toxin ParE1/3/4